ncbi:hypothetical protein HMPREF9141_2762 [Prevotella multiformis DSM 16608]|uniref:Uncharacterized protein n=1 Tax=Prevotella multiformis DSM 16608 TaxID=888743 RepID=F0FAZ5_9BACT|nr:hypothetical protein HMPREF9141_2762 [Prevotella multiformis DSM 16608]
MSTIHQTVRLRRHSEGRTAVFHRGTNGAEIKAAQIRQEKKRSEEREHVLCFPFLQTGR